MRGEDYSEDGNAWEYLPHDHARSRAFRWNEDGIAGVCDRHQKICFALALWNGRDPILKERLFGLAGRGESRRGRQGVLLLPRQHADALVHEVSLQVSAGRVSLRPALEENRRATGKRPEFELLDTGIFDDSRYFDVFVEYAKAGSKMCWSASPSSTAARRRRRCICCRRSGSAIPGPGTTTGPNRLRCAAERHGLSDVGAPDRRSLGRRWLYTRERRRCCSSKTRRTIAGSTASPNASPLAKDGINDYIVNGIKDAVNPHNRHQGERSLRPRRAGRATVAVNCGFTDADGPRRRQSARQDFDDVFVQRRREADEFYSPSFPRRSPRRCAQVMRQAFAGFLWSKQFYHYVVEDWLTATPPCRRRRRSAGTVAIRVAAPLQRRRHLHAGQVGVSVVRRLGPGLPLRRRSRRPIPDFAKEQLAVTARMVHAPQRPVAGL